MDYQTEFYANSRSTSWHLAGARPVREPLPGLLVLDMNGPDLSALEIGRRFKRDNPNANVMVLAGDDAAAFVEWAQEVSGELGDVPWSRRDGADLDALTAREVHVLGLIGQGLDNATIASRLGISKRTVETHVSRIYNKLDLEGRAQAVLLAVRQGLVLA